MYTRKGKNILNSDGLIVARCKTEPTAVELIRILNQLGNG